MATAIEEYWSGGGIKEKEKRFFALSEACPVRDLNIQLQELKKILEEFLEKPCMMIKEEEEAMRMIICEIEKLLAGEKDIQSFPEVLSFLKEAVS